MRAMDSRFPAARPSHALGCVLASLAVLLPALFGAGCAKPLAYAVIHPPFIPAQYYNCIDVTPDDLANAYFNNCAEIKLAENLYNELYFVFKDLELRSWMLTDLTLGYLWVNSGIKCLLANPEVMRSFKLGEKIDLVGYNSGVGNDAHTELLFKDCYVMPAGSLQLPAAGGMEFVPTY